MPCACEHGVYAKKRPLASVGCQKTSTQTMWMVESPEKSLRWPCCNAWPFMDVIGPSTRRWRYLGYDLASTPIFRRPSFLGWFFITTWPVSSLVLYTRKQLTWGDLESIYIYSSLLHMRNWFCSNVFTHIFISGRVCPQGDSAKGEAC